MYIYTYLYVYVYWTTSGKKAFFFIKYPSEDTLRNYEKYPKISTVCFKIKVARRERSPFLFN